MSATHPPDHISPERTSILSVIASAGDDGATLDELRESDAVTSPYGSIRYLVSEMKKDGLIEPVGRGRYRALQPAMKLVREVSPEYAGGDGARSLPLIELRVNMTSAELVLDPGDEEVVHRYYVDVTEVEGLPEGEGFVTQMFGDSMYPMFAPGEHGVFRRFSGLMTDLVDAYYLFRLDGVFMFKGIQRLPGRQIRIFSVNPNYRDVELDMHDESVDFTVLAVLWGNFKRYYR